MINEDRESLSLSPECFSLRKTYNRPVSLITLKNLDSRVLNF